MSSALRALFDAWLDERETKVIALYQRHERDLLWLGFQAGAALAVVQHPAPDLGQRSSSDGTTVPALSGVTSVEQRNFYHGILAALAVVDAHGAETIGQSIVNTVDKATLFAIADAYDEKVLKSLGVRAAGDPKDRGA